MHLSLYWNRRVIILVLLRKNNTVVVGNGDQMWYLSQVKGPAEDDLVEGDTIDDSVFYKYRSFACREILSCILLDL